MKFFPPKMKVFDTDDARKHDLTKYVKKFSKILKVFLMKLNVKNSTKTEQKFAKTYSLWSVLSTPGPWSAQC